MRNLDMAIRRMGTDEAEFLSNRSLIANAVVGQMLPDAVVKGGSSLKIRFGDASSRATTDLDVARSAGKDEFATAFAQRLAAGWEGFTGRLVEMPQAHPDDVPGAYVMQPYAVKLSYLGKPWFTVEFELGHNEIGDADDADMVVPADADSMLSSMGFPSLEPIPLMPLRYQIAQKLHGLTEPGSQRAHDLVDLQIIASNGEVNLVSVKDVCVRLFAYRQMQEWPPTVTINEGWEAVYAEAADGLDVLANAIDAVAWANDLVQSIEEAH
jgi:hypothetical protein